MMQGQPGLHHMVKYRVLSQWHITRPKVGSTLCVCVCVCACVCVCVCHKCMQTKTAVGPGVIQTFSTCAVKS